MVVLSVQGFLTESLPEPYKSEMMGLAEASKLKLGKFSWVFVSQQYIGDLQPRTF
jgi:hypothetical protein